MIDVSSRSRLGRVPLVLLVVAALLLTHLEVGFAQSVDCSRVVEDSTALYYDGRFDRAIDALNHCLKEEEISDDDREQAFRVLGLCYLAKDYVDQARGSIEQLLYLVPDWKPDPQKDPQAFQMLVSDVKEEMKRRRDSSPGQAKSRKRLWLVGGIVALGAAVAALVAGGGGGSDTSDEDLPAPPALPEK